MNTEIIDWVTSDDTGVSSKQILRVWHGLKSNEPFGYPHDSGDFGRCYRLLKKCPEIKIECMRGFNRIWDKLVDQWGYLTECYERNDCLEIYRVIKKAEEPYSNGGCMSSTSIIY